jgi:hypothetical protein
MWEGPQCRDFLPKDRSNSARIILGIILEPAKAENESKDGGTSIPSHSCE